MPGLPGETIEEKNWCTANVRNARGLTFQAKPLRQRGLSLSNDESPSLKTLDFAFYIDSRPTFLYFDLYLNTAFAQNVRLRFLY